MTTYTVKEQKLFIATDLIYDHVHAWCGEGVSTHDIENWINILDEIKQNHLADNTSDDPDHPTQWTYYAGHGGHGDDELIDNVQKYLRDFLDTVTNETSRDKTGLVFQSLPQHSQEDFLLLYSINNHVPADEDEQDLKQASWCSLMTLKNSL